jgi:hypothetical protein
MSDKPSSPVTALVAVSLGLASALPLPVLAQSRQLEFPRGGVVCDRAVRICYDSDGTSAPLTRRYFGERAERDLVRQLSGRPRPRQFEFSTGEVCDLRSRTCWDDGWQRTNVSNRLSRQLFGNTAGTGWGGNTGWGNNRPGDSWQSPNQDTGFCQLSQRGRRILNGECDLLQRRTSGGTAYVVDFRNGRRYSFYDRQGWLEMRDATGTWPVTAQERGGATVFRWSDMELSASRGGPGPWSDGGAPVVNPSGQALFNLINNLFR